MEANVRICDRCKRGLGLYKCLVCGEDLCGSCSNSIQLCNTYIAYACGNHYSKINSIVNRDASSNDKTMCKEVSQIINKFLVLFELGEEQKLRELKEKNKIK